VHIGARLESLRAGRNISQARLASRAGLHPMTVQAIEANKRSPNVSTLAALARALGVAERALLPAPSVTAPWELVALELDLRFSELEALRAEIAAQRGDIELASADLVRGIALRRRRTG
jgi:transcriptional regulator with XRE-family HTH domain